MTQYPEAVLARELQMCYSAIALATDYDSGVVMANKIKPVSAKEVGRVLEQNIGKAKRIFMEMLKTWPTKIDCGCQKSLDEARF